MVVLPYHHPLELAKGLGTLDVLSRGPVILGVGVGSLEPEFELLSHAFEGPW
jgi:alkanesulfonate monooxygenase SsuD/methylene tetrahydromethanopterin reductase-like flavin-dependent oxidoreductase (luciferase family)